ncbi:MAG: hypothetical protein Q4D38_00175 [Planctomycetia bacterium]|nr:hypothetical protein [Planctomycetia bacterium]
MADTSIINPNTTYSFGGGLNGSCAIVELTNGNDSLFTHDSIVARQATGQVQKTITTLYALGSNKAYKIDGRPTGTVNVQAAVGLGTQKFFSTLAGLADVCADGKLKIGTYGSCVCTDSLGKRTGAGESVTFTGCVLTGLAVQSTSDNYVIIGNCTFSCYDAVYAQEGAKPVNADLQV